MVDVATYPPRLLTRYSPAWPYLRWIIFVIGAVYCVASVAGLTGWPTGKEGIVSGDAWWYWQGTPYSDVDYRYSPAFYWLTLPLRALPWEVFISLWTIAHLAVIAWLGPWTILLAFDDVIRGNVNTFLAAAVVLAIRGHAWTWASVLLTKVTPGVGVLYYVPRREWRHLGVALAVTAAIVLVGIALDPALWLSWFDSLRAAPDNYLTVNAFAPVWVRVALGAELCLLSARWIWLLPAGMVVAIPGLWPASFAILAAWPRLIRGTRGPS